ncbi:MAG: ATP-binding protein, partial [Rubrivivax sp.]
RSVLPLLLAAPVVALGLWWLVGLSLAPLTPLAAAVRERHADALQPLPDTGLPSEISPLVRALNALLLRLGAAFDAQRAFVADAAHELRSPLTALKLQLEVLRGARDDGERAEAQAALAAGVALAQRLVEQLLALARAEPGGAESALAPLDLTELARQALADMAPLATAAGATLALDATAAVSVDGDAPALRTLLRNLVDNALRHAGPAAEVQVSVGLGVGPADGRPTLTVDDHGPGLPAAERERVFARFYRRDGQSVSGSGLGLAIVRTVAERHGATVALADAPGGGLRVQVVFPPAAPAAR